MRRTAVVLSHSLTSFLSLPHISRIHTLVLSVAASSSSSLRIQSHRRLIPSFVSYYHTSSHFIMSNSDPHHAYPAPPFNEAHEQKWPGSESELNPKADHGETSYKRMCKIERSSCIDHWRRFRSQLTIQHSLYDEYRVESDTLMTSC